jgi:16S rRNA C967 or C1407 C5-methylase (RsmB/RsmF family)
MTMDAYFSEIYGARWTEQLKPALLKPTSKVYVDGKLASNGELNISQVPVAGAYALDRASIEAVYALDLQPGQDFMDVCAAPGGKSLMALHLSQTKIQARLNDSSKDRIARLKAVMFDYLPEEVVKQIRITCTDGSRIGQREPESYDRVLADVPCSAERHHLQDGAEEKWTLKSSKRLSIRQHAILCSAIDSTRSGGRIVYSTCSLSPLENDGVITKLMKSRKNEFQIIKSNREMGEPTEHGRIILPDTNSGYGPIYYAILQKL